METEERFESGSDADKVAKLQESLKALQSKYEAESSVRRELLNQLSEVKGNIRVLARVRPLQQSEDPSPLDCTDIWTIQAPLSSLPPSSTTTSGPPSLTSSVSAPNLASLMPASAPQSASAAAVSALLNKKYQFDRVFGPSATQRDLYEEVSTLSTSLLDGFHCCLFAYGQTGSGKTFTMEGECDDPGMTPRMLASIFDEASQRDHMAFEMHLSIMEIYNEAILDLLDQSSTQAKIGASIASGGLKLRQGERGIFVPDATKIRVHTLKEIESAMGIAKSVRSVASTDMNEHSSRSHCVTMLEVCGRKRNGGNGDRKRSQHLSSTSRSSSQSDSDMAGGPDTVTFSRLFLIDLAGSERIAQSGAQGKALDEAKHINKSLSALARVMECLQLKRQHIPFRDSTLTHLLKDALVEAKTVMVLNLSPSAASYGQTVNSLNFGARVRKIERATVKRNFDLDRERYTAQKGEMEGKLSSLKSECQTLSSQLSQAKIDFSSEFRMIQAKNDETVAQLKQQLLQQQQLVQAQSVEMRKLQETHAQELSALKRAVAEAQQAQKQAEAAANAVRLQSSRMGPATVSTSILASQPMASMVIKGVKEYSENEDPVGAQNTKDKYIHQTTPIKPRGLTSLLVASTPVVPSSQDKRMTQLKQDSAQQTMQFSQSPSKLSSPVVVVDELQKLYLKHQQEGTPTRIRAIGGISQPKDAGNLLDFGSVVESAPVAASRPKLNQQLAVPLAPVPMMNESGILMPVVLTPQVARRTVIADASPIGFSVFNANDSIMSSIVAQKPLEASIIDDDSILNFNLTVPPAVGASVAPAPVLESAPVVATTLPESGVIKPAVEAVIAQKPQTGSNELSVRSISPTMPSNVRVASTASSQSRVIASSKLRSCFLDRTLLNRVKKSVTFATQLCQVSEDDPSMPIRRSATIAVAQAATSSSFAATGSQTLTGARTTLSSARATHGAPSSPIKSVAVRPAPSSGVSSSLTAPRRVVAKHTAPAPKATPGRVRPVGRTTAPLAGAPAVYKIY